jgi:uncharacterized protein (DUF983 family)
MSEVRATCPGCGKPVVFLGSFSMSSVCDACGTIVMRPDYEHPSTGPSGKIEPPIENESPLEIGMKGSYQGHAFEIRGVVRLAHDAGGFWDEWYLLFDDGRWGWLAEVQRHFYLTFAVEIRRSSEIPAFHDIQLEKRFLLRQGDPPMQVSEKGHGRPMGARGEIPYALAPQTAYPYADLSGPGGRFATIDYENSPPTVYFGRTVALGDLHLPHKPEDLAHAVGHVEAVHTICPRCHKDLVLRVPHKTVRVGCMHCGSLLGADEGQLHVERPLYGTNMPRLAIGARGQLFGVQYVVVGYLERYLKSDKTSTWEEYLLYESQVGYRWLTMSDDHWYFVQSVEPGNVELQGKNAVYNGKTYLWHDQDTAIAARVLGEFYWKVDPGEQVWMTDYLASPEMLSREITHGGPDTGEVSWSRAVYLSSQTVEQAFGLKHRLPRPTTIAPSQSSGPGRLYAWWGVMVALTIVMGLFFQVHNRNQKVFQKTYLLAPPGVQSSQPNLPAAGQTAPPAIPAPSARGDFGGGDFSSGNTSGDNASGGTAASDNAAGGSEGQIFFSEPFDVRANENIEIRVRALDNNFWLGLDGDLVDEQTGVIQEFSLTVEYYEGFSEGEAWSEGSRQASTYLSALPAGKYTMRLVGQHEPAHGSVTFEVSVYENVPRLAHFLLALVAVSVIPGVVLLMQCLTTYTQRR